MNYPAVVMIVNPIAGAGMQRSRFRLVVRRLRDLRYRVHVHETDAPGRGRDLAASVPTDTTAVVAVGGDGTVREVADGLTGRGIPMAIWPTGTENLVARFLGFQADARCLVGAIISGEVVTTDVGLVNGRSFLVVVGVGFDGEVAHRLVRLRTGHISHLTYAIPILRTFGSHRFPEMCIELDGQPCWQGKGLAFVGNIPQYAMGLRVVRDAVSDDGLLDLVIMPCSSQWRLLGHSFWTVLGRNVEHLGVIHRRGHHVRIDSPSQVPVEVDGDAWHFLPVEVGILPAAVCFKVPPGGRRG